MIPRVDLSDLEEVPDFVGCSIEKLGKQSPRCGLSFRNAVANNALHWRHAHLFKVPKTPISGMENHWFACSAAKGCRRNSMQPSTKIAGMCREISTTAEDSKGYRADSFGMTCLLLASIGHPVRET